MRDSPADTEVSGEGGRGVLQETQMTSLMEKTTVEQGKSVRRKEQQKGAIRD